MNSKQVAELQFWDTLINRLGSGAFVSQRRQDLFDNVQPYNGQFRPVGKGLEVGSGLFSQLEFLDEIDRSDDPTAEQSEEDKVLGTPLTTVIATDPLQDEYKKLLGRHLISQSRVELQQNDNEYLFFQDGEFNWIVCWNVIDHTPDPALLISEMHRVLKPGGELYFEVNFDDSEAPPHYGLWTMETVREMFPKEFWQPVFEHKFRNPDYPQWKYYAILRKL